MDVPAATPDVPAVLGRALRYPYDRPSGPVGFDIATGTARPLAPSDVGARGRTAVLAVGSNAAPEQLARKFAPDGPVGGTIPVLPVRWRDHDVVFAARLSSYGALPATPLPSDGTVVDVHVTLLDDDQLAVMHRSESVGDERPAYEVVEVAPRSVEVPGGAGVTLPSGALLAYASVAGPLHLDDGPVALAAVTASGRRHPARTEAEVLTAVARALGTDVADLVLGAVADRDRRDEVDRRLPAGPTRQRRP